MPGMATWELFRAAVRDCLGEPADETAVCIWAALHGLLMLRRDRPSFPWPDLDSLIDTVLAAHLRDSHATQPGTGNGM